MQAFPTTRTVLAVLAAATLGLVATGAAAALAEWSQDRVTQYANELAAATGALKDAIDKQPESVNPAAQRAFYAAQDDVRVMNNSAKHLATALKNGDGRDETAPVFRRIQSLRRDAEEDGRKALIPNQVMDKIAPVGAALIKLAPYYEERPEPGPAPGPKPGGE